MSHIQQYSQTANPQTLAAQQTLDTQQKHAAMFRGGYTAPNMGGNNPAAQGLANRLTDVIAIQQTQAVNDQRALVGGSHRHKKKSKTNRRVKRTHSKKRNKRITKRKHYTKRW